MKNILNKIEFHYSYLIIAFGFILTGYFLNLIIFTSLILIHELGHILFIKKNKLTIQKIIIYPYGGLVKYNNYLNIDVNKELLIAIFGIIFQLIYFIIIFFLFKVSLIREYTYNLFYTYNYNMLIFNILPIYPLDGSKIIELLLAKYFNYKLSIKITIIISIITLILSLRYYFYDYTYFIIIVILINNIVKYYKNINYIYYKFLLERYLYKINFKKVKIITNKNKMYRNKKHLLKEKDKYITEKNFLRKMFDNKYKL